MDALIGETVYLAAVAREQLRGESGIACIHKPRSQQGGSLTFVASDMSLPRPDVLLQENAWHG